MADKSEATRLLDSAVKLANNIQGKYFDLGEMLYELKENDYYKLIENGKYYSDNHSKWKQFCDENLPIGYRTAQYWLSIYRYFTDMGVEKERLAKVGWSKIKELIDLTDNTNLLEEALKVAETGSLKDVQSYVAHIKSTTEQVGPDTRETLNGKKFEFMFYEAAAETVDQILTEASLDTNGNMNEALFKVLIEWHQSRQDVIPYEVAGKELDTILA
jgi:hypothetical protein